MHSLYLKSNEDLIVREPMYQENICEQVIREELSHVLESSMFALLPHLKQNRQQQHLKVSVEHYHLSMVYAGFRYVLPTTAGTLLRVPYPN